MLALLVFPAVLVVASFIFVMVDAPTRDWSRWRDPGHPERMPLADGVGTWLIVLTVIWPVAAAGYLIDRRYAPSTTKSPQPGAEGS